MFERRDLDLDGELSLGESHQIDLSVWCDLSVQIDLWLMSFDRVLCCDRAWIKTKHEQSTESF